MELTVELDVRDDPKSQDQISDRSFYGRWSLRKVSRYGKSSIKPPGGSFISTKFERGVYFIKRRFWNHFSIKNWNAKGKSSGT